LTNHEAERDPKTKKFKEVSKEELLKLPRGLNSDKKKQMLQELCGSNSPFKLEKVKDGLAVASAGYGRMAYMELAGISKKLTKSPFRKDISGDGEKLKEISSFPVVGKCVYYFLDESDNLYRQEKKTGEPKEETEPDNNLSEIIRSLSQGEYLYLSEDQTIKINEPINTTDKYINVIHLELQRIEKERQNADSKYEQWYLEIIRRISFHLHGFAMQALETGDTETYQSAKKVAETIVSESEFVDILRARMGSDGSFYITKDDVALE